MINHILNCMKLIIYGHIFSILIYFLDYLVEARLKKNKIISTPLTTRLSIIVARYGNKCNEIDINIQKIAKIYNIS